MPNYEISLHRCQEENEPINIYNPIKEEKKNYL